MARPDDDAAPTLAAALFREEGALAAHFAAARAETAPLPPALLAAILADADAVRLRGSVQVAQRARPWAALGALLRPIGGLGGAAALAGCAALGFWAGVAGTGADLAAGALWGDLAAAEAAAAGVDGFFDLAPSEVEG